MSIIPERLSILEDLVLGQGSHRSLGEGACVLEAVAWVAGEPWSDHPECASPVLGAFLRAWNDTLPDSDRNRLLKPLIPRLVGTKGTPAQEDERAWMALDWLVREYTPVWLRLAHLDSPADLLAGLPEFRAGMDVPSVKPTIEAVRKDAAAAGDAAGDAAWDAAWAAAWDAARDAAWDAAWAADEILTAGPCRPHGHFTADEGRYRDDTGRLQFERPCLEHHLALSAPNVNCGQPWCSVCGLGLVSQSGSAVRHALNQVLDSSGS